MNIEIENWALGSENIESNVALRRKVAGILTGLSLLTTGNAVAVAVDTNSERPDSEIAQADIGQPPINHSNLETNPTAKPSNDPSQLMSGLRPLPYPEIDKPKPPLLTPSPKPSSTSSPSATSTELPQIPKPPMARLQKLPNSLAGNPEVQPMSKLTEANIEAMELTIEGYTAFLKSINTSHFDYAQQFTPFNPNKVAIEQGETEFITAHFTTVYSNFDGMSKTEAKGSMDVERLIKDMGERHSICCGINWILDRNAIVHQTAPIEAKLRHNAPYDPINLGFEIESVSQDGITTKQYEAASYLTLAVLSQKKLLHLPLSQTFHGHGEDRDKYRHSHPDSPWHARNDFDAAVMVLIRQKLKAFIDQNPSLASIPVAFK